MDDVRDLKIDNMLDTISDFVKGLSDEDIDFIDEISGDIVEYLKEYYNYVDIRVLICSLFKSTYALWTISEECGGTLEDVMNFFSKEEKSYAEIIEFDELRNGTRKC